MNPDLRPHDRIRVQCPQGHELYPDGVYVKTLFNNYGVQLARAQRVEYGVTNSWIRARAKSLAEKHDLELSEDSICKVDTVARAPAYRLTAAQWEWMKHACKACDKKE